MNEHPTDLERQLGELGWWNGAAPRLWEAAERSARTRIHAKGRIHRMLRSPWPWVGVPVAAVIAVAVLAPGLGKNDLGADYKARSASPEALFNELGFARSDFPFYG